MSKLPKFTNNFSLVLHSWRRKPALIFKGLSFLVRRLLGKKVVRGMDIAITYACNLKCDHCNVAGLHDTRRKELDVEEIVGAIRQLQEIGGFYVTFTGGEVLLHLDKLEKIIATLGRISMLYQVQTNGTLLSDSVCKRLQKMGVDNVQISFDAHHESGDWQHVLTVKENQVAMLKKWGFKVFFTWLASHQSLSQQEEIADMIQFSEEHKVSIGLNFSVPQGRWSGQEEILLKPEDSTKVRRLAHENRHLYIDLQNNLFHYGCPAFTERLHINAYGDVQPCTFFQISFGNIRQESLRDILARGLKTSLFANFPDHCPPAENNKYIAKWMEMTAKPRKMPIHAKEFFK